MKVAAVVQAVPWRKDLAEYVGEQARIGGCSEVTVLFQEDGVNPWDHFFNVFQRMYESDADLVVRFEDDALISPYLAHNCSSWPAVQSERFGCGLLYSPITSILDYIYEERPTGPIRRRYFAGAVAQLWRRKDLPEHITGMKALLPEFTSWGHPFDIIVSAHCYDHGWELYTHNPPIVEHIQNAESAIGNARCGDRTTGGAFNPRFYR